MAKKKQSASGSTPTKDRVKAGLVEKDFVPQPNDEATAAGEAVGDVSEIGTIEHQPSTQGNPYVSQEEQGMEMRAAVVGPPAYGSPDPTTSAGRLVPLEDHPLRADLLPKGHPAAISEDYGKGYSGRSDLERHTSGDFGVEGNSEVNATDSARTLADEHGVDLNDVEGTGDGGRVTKTDVEDYLDAQENV